MYAVILGLLYIISMHITESCAIYIFCTFQIFWRYAIQKRSFTKRLETSLVCAGCDKTPGKTFSVNGCFYD